MLQAWHPSIHPSVTLVNCDQTVQEKVEIGTWQDRLVSWQKLTQIVQSRDPKFYQRRPVKYEKMYWIITNTSTTDTTWLSYSLLRYLLPFPTNHDLDFIHIHSHASVLTRNPSTVIDIYYLYLVFCNFGCWILSTLTLVLTYHLLMLS